MNTIISHIASAGATKISSLTGTICRGLLRSGTCSSSTPVVNTCVPVREKCFDHHFLNRWMCRDYKRRLTVREHYTNRLRLMTIKKTSILPKEITELASQEVANLPRNAHPTRLINRCILTSRPRWVIWRFRLSRIQYRLLADYNKLSGTLRACW